MRRIWLVIGAVLLVGAGGFLILWGSTGANRPALPPATGLELRADRGAPDYVPADRRVEFTISGVFEDTVEAMDRALARGMPTLELPVRLSRDGHLVVFADELVDRVTDGHGRVTDFTLAELRQLDAGNGAHIPALEDIFSRYGARARYVLEIPTGEYFQPLEQRLVEMVQRHQLADRVAVASPFPWVLGKVEAHAPELRTELMVGEGRSLLERLGAESRWLDFYRIDGVQLAASSITPEKVADLHRRGLYVTVRSVMDEAGIEVLKAAGVDAALTFFTSFQDLPPELPPHYLQPENQVVPGPAEGTKPAGSGSRSATEGVERDEGAERPDEPAGPVGAGSGGGSVN